jgi:hypothetical protein
MKFTAAFQIPRLDGAKYAKILREQFTDHLTEAAVEWLGAVTPKIPVWSGASIATFLPLARAVSYPLMIQPSLLSRGSRVSLGLDNAVGTFDVDEGKGEFTFTYSTTLAHLIWNEFNNANIHPDPTKWPPPAELITPGPYGFQGIGQEAFERYARGVTLPDPFLALRITTIRVN